MLLITELKQVAEDYETGSIEIAPGLIFSQYRTLRKIDFYTNSRYLNGNKDSLNRDIPFYNIVNTMVDTAVVATDIDTKDIVVEADDEDSYDQSFLFNHEIQKWMKESDFAKSLNEQGEIRARYGGVLIKKCMEDGAMRIDTVEWKNLVTDPSCIEDGYIIERHFLTPWQMLKKKDVWEDVNEAIDMYSGRKGYTRIDQRIEVWEVEGVMPKGYETKEGDGENSDDYYLQHHFYAVKGNKQVHLFWEKRDESFYKYLPWKKVAGRALGRGVVEEGDEAQVWTNDAIQKEQAVMELAGRVAIKTNSKKIGNNVLSDWDNGKVLYLEDGKDANVMNMLPAGILAEFQNQVDKWWSQYERSTSSYDAVRGETPPSGQPYRLQALVEQQGSSHFDYRREEWGIFLKEVFYDWVFPYIQKRLSKAHILASDFSPEELKRLDESFALHEATNYAKEKILSGAKFTREDYIGIADQYQQFIGRSGKRRFLDIPDGYYKDMKARLSINITGEQKNKQAAMETLGTLLTQMLPMVQAGIVSGEDVKVVLNKIMELTGGTISPLSLSKSGQQTQQVGAGVGAGAPTGAPAPVPSPMGGNLPATVTQ